MLDREQKRLFCRHGLLNVRQLFSTLEVERYRQHSTDLRAAGSYFGHSAGIEYGSYTDTTSDRFAAPSSATTSPARRGKSPGTTIPPCNWTVEKLNGMSAKTVTCAAVESTSTVHP